MKTGLCNEVYKIKIKRGQTVILRLNRDKNPLKGSDRFIPLFKAKNIPVPTILSRDYSKKTIPYAYQILSEIKGNDIGEIIGSLTKPQLKNIAKEISSIFNKLKKLPTNGKFGWVGYKDINLHNSWTKAVKDNINITISRGKKTKILNTKDIIFLHEIFEKNKSYFGKVKSIFYYDDMSSKNVMINKGRFNGIVDLDGVSYGDYLETIGRIKASWYGTKNGKYYTECIMTEQRLSKNQIKITTIYALLHSLYWMCENGIKFNDNTTSSINKNQFKKDSRRVKKLKQEYLRHTQPPLKK